MKYLFLSIIHAMKVGTVICMIMVAIMCISLHPLESQGTFVNILFICALTAVIKYVCGGWSSSSLKGMSWSVILSTVASIVISVLGMKLGGGSISFWILFIPLVFGVVGGICAYKWVEDIVDNDTASSITGEGILESVIDNGLRNTFDDFMSICEGNLYYSASRGVAVYSNIVIILSLLLFWIYK